VTTAQYMLVGMLVKPLASPSITYMSAPTITTTVAMPPRNTTIFRRLARSAVMRSWASPRNRASLRIRNTRSRRTTRTTISQCASGTTSPR